MRAGLILAPAHKDLHCLAEAVHAFLVGAFKTLPRDSGIKAFLRSSNHWGWQVKRKLVWLGTCSYPFRLLYAAYLKEQHKDPRDIEATDDFLCQECTAWSGLGAIDLLAGLLDILDEQRRDLRSWYERHASFYRIDSASDDVIDAVNVIGDRRYRIRMNQPGHPFRPGSLVFGSLVPWRGEWYWSGLQRQWAEASGFSAADLQDTMKRNNSAILCRFWPQYEALVRERAADLHQRMLAFYGKDLIVYPDGLSMAADGQREIKANWASRSPEELEETLRRHGITNSRPAMPIPEDLLNHTSGIGVYLNPDEGKEIMSGFNDLLNAFQSREDALTEDQADAIRGFLNTEAIGPGFVRRLVGEYGDRSIRKAFLFAEDSPPYWLDYLLQTCKGHFYRKRYPTLSVL